MFFLFAFRTDLKRIEIEIGYRCVPKERPQEGMRETVHTLTAEKRMFIFVYFLFSYLLFLFNRVFSNMHL